MAFMTCLINENLVCARWTFANDWNAAYRSKIIDRQSRYRSRDLEVVLGSLIDCGDLRGVKVNWRQRLEHLQEEDH